ncbi:hypothetical protein [Marinitoga lauensis]|nr:hypothetical protein [Marinitoga lauensis]
MSFNKTILLNGKENFDFKERLNKLILENLEKIVIGEDEKNE